MKEELKHRFDEFKSESSAPELNWENIGPKIQKGIAAKKKKKRRGFFWLFFGMGVFVIAFLSIILNQDVFSKGGEVTSYSEKLNGKSSSSLLKSNNTIKKLEPNKSDGFHENQSIEVDTPATPHRQEVTQESNDSQVSKVSDEENELGRIDFNVPSNETLLEKTPTDEAESSASNSKLIFDLNYAKADKGRLAFPLLSKILLTEVASIHETKEVTVAALNMKLDQGGNEQTVVQKSPFSNWTLDFTYGLNRTNIADALISSSDKLGNYISSHIEYTTPSSFVIGTGFTYDNVRFQSTAQRTDSVVLYRPNTIDTIFRYSDDFEFYAYKDSIDGILVNDFGHTNQVRNYSIPLFIGYDWKISRVLIGVRGGLNFQIRQQIVGRLLNEDLEIIDVDETYTNSSIHHYLRIQFGYQFSDRWSLWTHFRGSAVSRFENPVNSVEVDPQSLFSGGIGVRVRL